MSQSAETARLSFCRSNNSLLFKYGILKIKDQVSLFLFLVSMEGEQVCLSSVLDVGVKIAPL